MEREAIIAEKCDELAKKITVQLIKDLSPLEEAELKATEKHMSDAYKECCMKNGCLTLPSNIRYPEEGENMGATGDE